MKAKRILELRASVTELLSRLDPVSPQLSDEEWQMIGRKILAEERQTLTSNVFARDKEITLNRVDMYVPLGVLERSKSRQGARNLDEVIGQQKQGTIQPITEDEFLNRVLLQGHSPKSQGQRIAIIGEPGSGKTTRLEAIADWVLESGLGLPIWVPLRLLGDRSIGNFLRQWLWDATGKETLWDNFLEQLRAGKVWLLMDGLDELTGRVQEQHERLVTGFWSDARIVLSCRVNVWDIYRGAFEQFDEYRNLDFDTQQIEDYIQRWFSAATQPEVGKDLWTTLQDETRTHLLHLARNPLRLSLLCCAWFQKPHSRTETQARLYGQLVELVYEWKRWVINITPKERHALQKKLSELALVAIEGTESTEKNAHFVLSEGLLKQVFGGLDDPLCAKALQLGWLNHHTGMNHSGEAIFSFYHATFQEYFAALGIDDWNYFLPRNHIDRPILEKSYRIFEPRWKQVILIWLGRQDIEPAEKEAFIHALVTFKDGCYGFYQKQSFLLSALAINEFKECSLIHDIVAQVASWGFGSFDAEAGKWSTFLYSLQKKARDIIPQTIRTEVINALSELLALSSSKDEYICQCIADSLVKIDPRNKGAVMSLCQIIKNSKDEKIRQSAVESFLNVVPEDAKAIATLIEILNDSKSQNIRQIASKNLDNITHGDAETVTSLVQLLSDSTEAKTCQAIAGVLIKVAPRNIETTARLVQLLNDSTEATIRQAAARVLIKVAPRNIETVASLVQRFNDSTELKTQQDIASILIKIAPENTDAIAALMRFLKNSIDTNNHHFLMLLIKEFAVGNTNIITSLIQLINDSTDENTRSIAANILGEIAPGNMDAIASLSGLINNSTDENTRCTAAKSFGKIVPENADAIAHLIRLINDSTDGKTRWILMHSLGKVGRESTDAIDTLIELAKNSEEKYIHWRAAEILGEIAPKNPRVTAILIQLIKDSNDEHARQYTASILGKISSSNTDVIAKLIQLIKDSKDEDICQTAAEILGEIAPGNADAIAVLVQLLKDRIYTFHYEIEAERLVGIILKTLNINPRNADAIFALVQFFKSSQDEHARQTAVESLIRVDPAANKIVAPVAYSHFYESRSQPIRLRIVQNLQRMAHSLHVKSNFLDMSPLHMQVMMYSETSTATQRLEKVMKSLGKIAHGNATAIATLSKPLKEIKSEQIRRSAAEILINIDPENSEVVPVLIQLLKESQNEYIRRSAAKILIEVAPENSDVITLLIWLIGDLHNKYNVYRRGKYNIPQNRSTYNTIYGDIRRNAVEILIKAGSSNSNIIVALLQLFKTSTNEETGVAELGDEPLATGSKPPRNMLQNYALLPIPQRLETNWDAIHVLETIAPGNLHIDAIATLIEVLEGSNSHERQQSTVHLFKKIATGNPDVIASLVKLINDSTEQNTLHVTARVLGEIAVGNLDAIASLVKLIHDSTDQDTLCPMVQSLGKIAIGNADAIAGLTKLINKSTNPDIRRVAASALAVIDPGNASANATFVQLFNDSRDEESRESILWALRRIAPGNASIISFLAQLLKDFKDAKICRSIIFDLGTVASGNADAIIALAQFINESKNIYHLVDATYSLEKILTPEHCTRTIASLKSSLSNEVHHNNFPRFDACYEIVWTCAEMLSYSDFYQAWHYPALTYHPEVEDTTPAGSTLFTQHCNLTLLPQIINQAIHSCKPSLNRQVICIDSSRFSDLSNPAGQIYMELENAGCPERDFNNLPEDIGKLQTYCAKDLRKQHSNLVALILYEDPTNASRQAFNTAVLNQLARFSYPPIAIIIPERRNDCHLQQFLATDPNLVTVVLQWLQRLEH